MSASREKPVPDFSGKPDPEQVRYGLAGVLSSPSFRGSKRCTDLLSYVVDKTLEGKGKSIEESALAIEVFGREEDGGPADYGIVRVGAREVRKRLAQYYEAEGAQDDVRIDLPENSYIPKFRALKLPPGQPRLVRTPRPIPPTPVKPPAVVDPPQVLATAPPPPQAPIPVVVPEPVPLNLVPLNPAPLLDSAPAPDATPTPELAPIPALAPPPTSRRVPWIGIAAGVAALLAILFAWRSMRGGAPEFDRFWGPAFNQESPIQIVLGQPSPAGQPADFGKTTALSLLSQTFGQRTRQVEVTQQADPSAAKDSTLVFLGGIDNPSAMQWSKDFRFHFARQGGQTSIADSSKGKAWTSTDGDYFLICRIPPVAGAGFAVLAGGVSQTAFAEAGRVLASAGTLAPLLKKLPPDWASRNLELVLKSPGRNRTPELVDSYIW